MTGPRDDGPPPPLPGQLSLFSGAIVGVAAGERWRRREPRGMDAWDGLDEVTVIGVDAAGVQLEGYGGRRTWISADTLRRDYTRQP